MTVWKSSAAQLTKRMSQVHLFGCVCACVNVRVFVFAFSLLGYSKCKISFDISQVPFKSQQRAAKYIPLVTWQLL